MDSAIASLCNQLLEHLSAYQPDAELRPGTIDVMSTRERVADVERTFGAIMPPVQPREALPAGQGHIGAIPPVTVRARLCCPPKPVTLPKNPRTRYNKEKGSPMSLHSKISLGATAAILAASLVTLYLNVGMFSEQTRQGVERQLMDIATLVAQFPEIQDGLQGPPHSGVVQARAQKVLLAATGVDHITVCNMQRIRYSHSNPEFIGLIQEGDDVKEVLIHARRYFSYDHVSPEDASGGFLRAYAPVFAGSDQVGFVIAGARRERVENLVGHLSASAAVYALAGLCLGILGALLLAHGASKTLLGLEPEEITRVYRQHVGLIEAMHEGVVAVDRRGRISLINKSARQLLDLGDRQVDGLEVDRVLPTPRLPSVVATGEAEFGVEKRINDRLFIANMVPVRENERVVGAVETFQDRTQLIRMAEELTGIRQLVEALRASSHEFSNKLHVILGLLELEAYDEAKKYVQTTQSEHGKLHTRMLRTFREPMIAGLMLGKFSVARERGIDLGVTPDSQLRSLLPGHLAHSLVLVLGNLVDNALDALKEQSDPKGRISVDIRENNGTILLDVEDNGPGVQPGNREAIFQRGFSTKGEGRGTGLHLVRQEMELLGGRIDLASRPGRTVFSVEMPINNGRTAE